MGPIKARLKAWKARVALPTESTNASSSNLSESCVPPTDPPPTANSGVEEHQLQAKPREPQTLKLSTSQTLWNAAYDSVEKDDADLVEAYVKTLDKVLRLEASNHPTSDIANVAPQLKDPTRRQIHMLKLVKEGRDRVKKAAKITKGVGDFVDAILQVKPMVDLAMTIPHAAPAALPWAGVCIGLQILSNPAKAMDANLGGIAHVVSRMKWYCALTDYLLNGDNIKIGNESFKDVLGQLEERVISLYKALLVYQMNSICSYYRHQGIQFFRGLLNLDDWNAYLKDVTYAEDAVRNDVDQYMKADMRNTLEGVAKDAEEMKELLKDILQTIRDFISTQKDFHREDKETACLRDLRVVDPQHHMERIEYGKGGLLGDAYKWILGTQEYTAVTNWDNSRSNSSPCRLLWIRGHAGAGKTMLMIGIIRELTHRLVIQAPKLSFFLCQATDKALNNATAVLRSLIWLLLIQQPHLRSNLLQKHKESGSKLFNDENAFFALSEAFRNMLQDSHLSPVYFVVDALDECEHGLPDLINLISSSLRLSDKVKWLVSSRPEVELDSLGRTGSLLSVDAQNLEGPVKAYINHKLSALNGRKGYTKDVLAQVEIAIRQRAENTFLWVSLAFMELDKRNKHNRQLDGSYALDTVKNMPPGLSKLYGRMMDVIEDGFVKDPQYCKSVLAAAYLAYRPLSLTELAILADLPSEITPTIVEKCGSFLMTTGETVALIHQSAKDYLKENYTSRLQPAGPVEGHADIGRRSLDAMSLLLKQNMHSLGYGFKPKDMRVPDADPLDPIRYSCVFWAEHLCSLDRECSELQKELVDNGRVHMFLREHVLHWLESLSLLGKLSDGVQSLKKLLYTVQLQPAMSHQLLNFLKDAEKFTLSHGSIIEQAPLQTYGSALVFSPTTSIVKNAQWKERLPFIDTVAGIKDYWDAHQQTLEGHSDFVWAVAFSPDGKILASASYDKTVRLWDSTTGTHQQTLEGHSHVVKAVVFSPDSKILASASDDKTVRLWDATTGTHQQTLEGHSYGVSAVVFSPDGKILASASDDNTVRLWDATSGTHQQTLEGHNDYVSAVAFSPDGKILASASDDNTVRLWDATTGTHQQTLEGHSYGVSAVAFSPDGKILASASYKTVRLWDATSGTHQQTLEGHSYGVRAVVFSPDGKILASASNDKTVRLWDATSGTHQQTLEGHSYGVRAVAFSPDGKILASASDDKTVRLWDATSSTHQQTLEGHSDYVKAVVFSPDGKILASASNDKTVRLWDSTSGTHQQTLEGHNDYVIAVVFSPDGKILASASYDKTVRLWDATSGTHQQTLEGHSYGVSAVAFSPDGKILASASNDKTVRLWDATSGTHQQTLEGHSDYIIAVVFSPDGRILASASDDKTVRLWDATTGTHQQTLEGHSDYVIAVVFSPDGKILASASYDKTVRLWDATSGIHQQTLEGHNDYVSAVVFSPDGKILASASNDKTVRLWDATTGTHQQTLKVDRSPYHLSFDITCSYLYTDIGTISIDKPLTSNATPMQILPQKPRYTGYGISVDNEWITRDSENLLWLRQEYRPSHRPSHHVMVREASTMAFGCKTGRVLILGFSQ